MDSFKDIHKDIIQIFTEVCYRENINKLNPDLSINDQIKFDSLDKFDVFSRIYSKYGINIPHEDYKKLLTINMYANSPKVFKTMNHFISNSKEFYGTNSTLVISNSQLVP